MPATHQIPSPLATNPFHSFFIKQIITNWSKPVSNGIIGPVMFSWFRRTRHGQTANGHQINQLEPFNPNHRRYQTCCCHCKTFTLGFGVVELFLICFMLVAIAPDFNSKICERDGWQRANESMMADSPNQPQMEQAMGSVTKTGNVTETPNVDLERKTRQAVEGGGQERNETGGGGGGNDGATAEQPNLLVPDVLNMIAQRMHSTAAPPEQAEGRPVDEGGAKGEVVAVANGGGSKQGADSDNPSTTRLLRDLICSLTVLWLVWAILQMCSIGLMCYGMKRQRWLLLVPHIFFRLCCALAIWLVIAAQIGAFYRPEHGEQQPPHGHLSGQIVLCVCLFIVFLWLCCLLKSEIRCCDFIKRSAETGLSVSNTRPIGPPTLSHTDSARAAENARRMVSTSIRKMPQGANARRYEMERQQQQQQGRQQQQQQQRLDENGNNGAEGNEMTMSTLMTAGGPATRPSTAGSLLVGKNAGPGWERRVSSANGGVSVGTPRDQRAQEEQGETEFGTGTDGRSAAGQLPPLRHTYKMAA